MIDYAKAFDCVDHNKLGKINAVLPPEFACSQCGKAFDAATKFCSECGGKVADKNAAPAAAPAVTPAPAVAPAPAAAPAAGAEVVSAPMPGTIVNVVVSAGQSVKSGDVLLVLEAMKMENEIMAPRDGVVAGVHVTKGESVDSGKALVSLQ